MKTDYFFEEFSSILIFLGAFLGQDSTEVMLVLFGVSSHEAHEQVKIFIGLKPGNTDGGKGPGPLLAIFRLVDAWLSIDPPQHSFGDH